MEEAWKKIETPLIHRNYYNANMVLLYAVNPYYDMNYNLIEELHSSYKICAVSTTDPYELIIGMLHHFGRLLHLFNLTDDEKVVSSAVTSRYAWHALKYASLRLRSDYDIVKLAVQSHGTSLEFASDELKRNVEIVSLAIADLKPARKFAHPEALQKMKL